MTKGHEVERAIREFAERIHALGGRVSRVDVDRPSIEALVRGWQDLRRTTVQPSRDHKVPIGGHVTLYTEAGEIEVRERR